MTGTGGLQRVPVDFVSNYPIPLPSIDIQRKAIEQVKQEQVIIQSNRELITRFEQKIRDRIARVWGE